MEKSLIHIVTQVQILSPSSGGSIQHSGGSSSIITSPKTNEYPVNISSTIKASNFISASSTNEAEDTAMGKGQAAITNTSATSGDAR